MIKEPDSFDKFASVTAGVVAGYIIIATFPFLVLGLLLFGGYLLTAHNPVLDALRWIAVGAVVLFWISFIGYLVVKEALNKNYAPVTLFCGVVGLFSGPTVGGDYPAVGLSLSFLGGAI